MYSTHCIEILTALISQLSLDDKFTGLNLIFKCLFSLFVRQLEDFQVQTFIVLSFQASGYLGVSSQ